MGVGEAVSVSPVKASVPVALMTDATVAYDVQDVVLAAASPDDVATVEGPLHDVAVIDAE
jgi:hypothetical protein